MLVFLSPFWLKNKRWKAMLFGNPCNFYEPLGYGICFRHSFGTVTRSFVINVIRPYYKGTTAIEQPPIAGYAESTS